LQAHLTTDRPVARLAHLSLCAVLGAVALTVALASSVHAETSNPNEYVCTGHIAAGQPELGSSEQQVKYKFVCNGPITGYQLQSQLPLTGFAASPLVTNLKQEPLSASFSCGGEIPGYAINCVGATQSEYQPISGQFSIGTPLCRQPLDDPLLTVTYAYLEKGVITQAISGPFDLGRPIHCPSSAYVGETNRLEQPAEGGSGHKGRKGKQNGHKSKHRGHKGKNGKGTVGKRRQGQAQQH
jgi:hypothetical protein